MKRGPLHLAVALAFATMAIIAACDDDNGGTDPGFDRKAMLQHFADNLIKPAFNELQAKVNALKTAADAFADVPDAAKLSTLQAAWDEAYSSWMYANAYNFGPAGEEGIRRELAEEIGTWPANITAIEQKIAAGNTSLNDFNRDNRGFNAIDYLIFDLGGNHTSIVAAFSSDPNRGAYLKAVAAHLKARTGEVADAWNGNYAATFVQKDGTDVGSSTSQLFNAFVKSFENAKNFKLGVPLGKRAGQTAPEPERVEARYNGLGAKYLRLHLEALEDIWHGRNRQGADGPGWKDYLASVTGGTALIERTEAQALLIQNALDALPPSPSFEQQIATNYAAWSDLHTELQKHTRNYKSDLSSLLGIAITFSSGDGD